MTGDIESTLSRLRDEFIAHLPQRIAHGLVGAAGVHRLMQVSTAAHQLEQIAAALPPSVQVNDADLRALHAAMAGLLAQAANPAYHSVSPPMKREKKARIMVVGDDGRQAAWLCSVLEEAGYQAEIFAELSAFRIALQQRELPAAVIMDMVFPQGGDAGAWGIAELKGQGLQTVPVILLSVRQDMEAKLAAHRAGATRYLAKPVERAALLRVIADASALAPTQPYRVLVVNDSKSQLAVHAHMLRHAGMEVREAINPLHVLDMLEGFAAEVLLLDMHMPQCSGPELAAILHDDERYARIPIVYLSTEADIFQQLLALDSGGDHFLVKPVNSAHLVAVVGMHARRFRQDMGQAKEVRAARYERERQQQAVDAHAIVSVADVMGNIVYTNDKFCEISGYAREELCGHNHRVVKSDRHPPEFYVDMWHTLASGKIWQGGICNRAKDGHLYWVETSIVPVMDDDGLPYQYISIRTDITHLIKVEQALLESKDAAESASRAKSEFLASMSHELRTPLNAILGFSQLFTMDQRLPQDVRDNAGEIQQAGQHLLSLINDMIDLSRIEAGRLQLLLEPVQIGPVLKEGWSMVESLARAKGIRLIETACGDQTITVRADRLRLSQVMINLISNAIKYNTPQGTVHIACNSHAGMLRISVSDTGPGIPADMQERIFNAFDRLGEERGEVEGTGIGLIITKRLVEAMGGSIGFESTVGQGSSFWVEFPLTGETPTRESRKTSICQAAEDASRQQEIRSVVLYIEDNLMNMRLMQQIFFCRKNLELLHANTAEIGIELARTAQPALILMDINLPGMDGYAALAALKADASTAHIRVVAVSANAMKGDEERGLDAGFFEYLTKPLDVMRLLALLDEVLVAAAD